MVIEYFCQWAIHKNVVIGNNRYHTNIALEFFAPLESHVILDMLLEKEAFELESNTRYSQKPLSDGK